MQEYVTEGVRAYPPNVRAEPEAAEADSEFTAAAAGDAERTASSGIVQSAIVLPKRIMTLSLRPPPSPLAE